MNGGNIAMKTITTTEPDVLFAEMRVLELMTVHAFCLIAQLFEKMGADPDDVISEIRDASRENLDASLSVFGEDPTQRRIHELAKKYHHAFLDTFEDGLREEGD